MAYKWIPNLFGKKPFQSNVAPGPDGLFLKKMKKSQILSKSDDLFLDGWGDIFGLLSQCSEGIWSHNYALLSSPPKLVFTPTTDSLNLSFFFRNIKFFSHCLGYFERCLWEIPRFRKALYENFKQLEMPITIASY